MRQVIFELPEHFEEFDETDGGPVFDYLFENSAERIALCSTSTL